MKTKLRESGVKVVRGYKPKSKSVGMSINIHCDDKKKPTNVNRSRDIVGTNKAIYIKSWKRWSDIRANNTNLKKACYQVVCLMKEFNERDVDGVKKGIIKKDTIEVGDVGFFFFNCKLAKDFVVGRQFGPNGNFRYLNVGERGDERIPTTKDLSWNFVYLSDRTNIQIIDKSTDNFSFTCGKLDSLVATKHLESEMYRKIEGRDGLKKDKGMGEIGANVEMQKDDIGNEFLKNCIILEKK